MTLFGIVVLFKDSQLQKAPSPMLVTVSGIAMLVKDSHPEKAFFPILLTLSGIVMLFKHSQPAKAPFPMLVTGWPPSSDGMVRAPDGLGDTSVSVAESSSVS